MSGGLDSEGLRQLIREVLRDALPGIAAQQAPDGHGAAAGPGMRAGPAQPGAPFTVNDTAEQVETVSLRTDQDLAAFVSRLLHLFENPARRTDLRTGRLRFRLAAAAGPPQTGPARRVERGAVTEAVVRDAARAGARLVLGPRAVLTPLARDRARAAGVEIERERS